MSTAIPNELVVIACGRAVIGEKERYAGQRAGTTGRMEGRNSRLGNVIYNR